VFTRWLKVEGEKLGLSSDEVREGLDLIVH
jgi:hypothetical protein